MEEYRLELNHISKSFPGVKALDDVSLKIRPGSVHALAGENGAGKSTLMKIVNGVYQADGGGEIRIDGKNVFIKDPVHARSHGISMIFQELNYVPELTIEENLFLCREPMKGKRGVFLDKKAAHEEAVRIIEKEGFHYDPKTKMKDATGPPAPGSAPTSIPMVDVYRESFQCFSTSFRLILVRSMPRTFCS